MVDFEKEDEIDYVDDYEVENDDKEEKDEKEDDYFDDFDFGIRAVIDVKENEVECKGHLQIIHTKLSEINVRTAHLKRKKFPNVDRGVLENRKLLNVRSIGNCCWAFFEKIAFKGEKEVITIGFEGLPQRRPKSIKRVSCSEVKEAR